MRLTIYRLYNKFDSGSVHWHNSSIDLEENIKKFMSNLLLPLIENVKRKYTKNIVSNNRCISSKNLC